MSANPSLAAHPRVEDWIVIRSDGSVVVRTGKVEIGQRIGTAVTLVAASELGVPFERIEIAPRRTGVSPDEGYTSGSNSMETSAHAVRLAAATARRELLARAAGRLGVDTANLEIHDGLVRSRDTNQAVGLGELVAESPVALAVDVRAPLRSVSAGRSAAPRVEPLHLREIVTGRFEFVHDLRPEGLLHARVIRPPHYHATLETLPAGIEAGLDGARFVRDGSFLAVVAGDEHLAIRVAERVRAAARWSAPHGLDERPVWEQLLDNRRESYPVRDGVAFAEPVPEPVPESLSEPAPDGSRTIRASYERPYQMHASLAPSAALARIADGNLTVWTHTQGIYPLRDAIAEALDLDSESVVVVHAPGAGCYGHNGSDDAALEAALVARRLPGRAVLLKWSREEEHAWEPYGPAMRIELRARLAPGGAVRDWSHETYSDTHVMRARPGAAGPQAGKYLASRYLANPLPVPAPTPALNANGGIHRNATPPYAFPRARIVKHLVHDLPLRVSAMRTLGAYANVFAAESFMDELAHAAAADPVDYRRRHLEDTRTRSVLDAAVQRFGWTPRPAGISPADADTVAGTSAGTDSREDAGTTAGTGGDCGIATDAGARIGRGIAVARYKNVKSYCAVAVEVWVGGDAKVRMRRAVIAVDAGEIVDPDGLAAQLEGGFVQAASWTLLEAVTWDRDGITSRDWDSYPILRFDEIPEIETVLLDRPGEPFLGAGEAACGPAGAAIANAVFDAVGVRARRLPLTPQALREAAARS